MRVATSIFQDNLYFMYWVLALLKKRKAEITPSPVEHYYAFSKKEEWVVLVHDNGGGTNRAEAGAELHLSLFLPNCLSLQSHSLFSVCLPVSNTGWFFSLPSFITYKSSIFLMHNITPSGTHQQKPWPTALLFVLSVEVVSGDLPCCARCCTTKAQSTDLCSEEFPV